MDRVRANSTYFFNPSLMDQTNERVMSLFEIGDKVRVVNLYGCPKANTMGHCYIVPATAEKDDRGNWNKYFAMVSVHSLQKEPATTCPTCQKARELKFPHPTPTHCSAECYLIGMKSKTA